MLENDDQLQKAIETVKNGGIIIYPTDTAFGIGCRIDNPAAVDRLLYVRKRPVGKPMPVLVSSKDMALTYFEQPSEIVRRMMEDHWPGALTIVARCKKELIYSPIRGGGDTIGLRTPNHGIPLKIIEAVGVPIIGSSANVHGGKTPYRMQDLDPELVKSVDFVMPGETTVGIASTVVDCSTDPYCIIRQGSITV